MTEDWQTHINRIEQLARAQGLSYHPVEFEVVPESFMTEIAIYGLPVRMPHWSFGVRYIYQLIQHRMGLSRLFEVVFPGNPGRAYLAKSNSAAENVLVTAHVLGHADFSTNNMLFRKSQNQVGEHIVEQAAAHARQIGMAIQEHGLERVESVLDAALSLEQHVDIDKDLRRPRYPELVPDRAPPSEDEFSKRFAALGPDTARPQQGGPAKRAPIPPHPEQVAIASYLDANTARLDYLTAAAEEMIDLLQERRTALITAAVTGKIDVRNAPTTLEVRA